MAYREFNLDKVIDKALDWASKQSEDDVRAFVYHILEDINAHSENRAIEDRFGETPNYHIDTPYNEVAKAISWDIGDGLQIAYELMYEVGRNDIARFILTL